MRVTTTEDELHLVSFVKDATEWFNANPWGRTYTGTGLANKEIVEEDCLFAVRWGMGDDCILVLRVSDTHAPIVYGQALDKPLVGIKEMYALAAEASK